MLKKEELDIVFVIVNRFLVEKISKKILNDDKNIILFSEKIMLNLLIMTN